MGGVYGPSQMVERYRVEYSVLALFCIFENGHNVLIFKKLPKILFFFYLLCLLYFTLKNNRQKANLKLIFLNICLGPQNGQNCF